MMSSDFVYMRQHCFNMWSYLLSNKLFILKVLSSVMIIYFLIMPIRFAPMFYDIEYDIVKHLGDEFQCKIDIHKLQSFSQSEMEINDLDDTRFASKYDINIGGSWSPNACGSKPMALIIPVRDREHQLKVFIRHIHPFLQRQNLSYSIFVIEQIQGYTFNKGKLINTGYKEAIKANANTDCIIIHDVDLLPLDARNIYSCGPNPRHLTANIDFFRFILPYKGLFGGGIALKSKLFQALNGFSNEYIGNLKKILLWIS